MNTLTTCLVVLLSPGKQAFFFSFYDQEEEPLGGQVTGPYAAWDLKVQDTWSVGDKTSLSLGSHL